MTIVQINPVINPGIMKLCTVPYPGHKKGCPNFNKRKGCPPHTPLFNEIINTEYLMYVIYNIFAFGEHVERMQIKHPDWSKRQLECCLYWQGTARKQLKGEIKRFTDLFGLDHTILTVPEAYGVNVTKTMKTIGVDLEWPPVKHTYQIAMAGQPI